MLNEISIMGRITADPKLEKTGSGVSVCTFSIAVDRDYSHDGERETDFFSVTAWRGKADFITKYFRKGQVIVIAGRLGVSKWTDRDGNKRQRTEIIVDNVYFGGRKPETAAPAYYEPGEDDVEPPTPGFGEIEDDGDLPF